MKSLFNKKNTIENKPTDYQNNLTNEQNENPSKNISIKNNYLEKIKKLLNRWFIQAFSGMAQGLFVTLIAGTIIKQIGKLILQTGTDAGILVGNTLNIIGSIASILMGAGIGAGIAKYLKSSNLVILSCAVAGIIGAFSIPFIEGSWISLSTMTLSLKSPGNPIGAYVCALIAAEIGNLVSGKTKVDILVVPLTVIIIAALSTFVAWPFIKFVDLIAKGIEISTLATPFLMGIIIAAAMGLLLTLPTSSAAIWIAIASTAPSSEAMLIAGGAACVGCCAHMVGFAVSSFKENKWGGLVAQGLGTSMLQIPNLMKNPKILIPQIVSSIVVGPLATTVFKLKCNASGGGMGTSGLVGIFGMIEASSGTIPVWQMWVGILLLAIILPAIISLFTSELLRKVNWIKKDDMKLEL